MAKKILVTGASGLIGRETLKQLQRHNQDVIGVDNNSRFDFRPSGNFVKSDLKEFLDTTKNTFDIIYHLAAINGTSNFYKRPNEVLTNNVNLDLAMFEYVKTNPNCKLIYASSSEVVSGTNNFPTTEETDVGIENIHNSRWSYRLPKILSENYLFNSNIDFLIIRFFNVFSEHSGAGHFYKDIKEKIKNNNFEIIGANETRSFCYVRDAVDAMINISQVSQQVINIGSDEEIKILDAANIIAQSMGVNNPKWLFSEGLEGSTKRRIPDISLLRSYYPDFNPSNFKEVISCLTDVQELQIQIR